MDRLVIQAGLHKGTEYSLREDQVTIGRSVTCQVRLGDSGVSREHCRVVRRDGGWVLVDLGSKNGTKVNGQQVQGESALRAGDRIEVGGATFSVEQASVAARPVAAASPAKAAEPETKEGMPAVAAPALRKRKEPEAPSASPESLEKVARLRGARDRIRQEIGKVIIGQDQVVEHLLIALFSRGHVLLVGVPGLAKTLMVRSLAAVLDLQFKRIQFTPDLMPSDITGTDILEEDPETGQRAFRFLRGPIFTNILLADEINRTPPKTQAALLEAMQEYRVTASGYSYDLALPFFVLATQNPIEQEGTYPLPEAQLDRFLFNIRVDYPTRQEEVAIVKATTGDVQARPEVVLTAEEILGLQRMVRQVPISDYVVTYATDMVRATRPGREGVSKFVTDYLAWGAGPRAAQCLVLGAKARAILDGRVNVSCNDVRAVAEIVLRHRIVPNFNADSEGLTPEVLVQRILETVKEPEGKDFPRPPRS